jgi:nicotinamidase-related amidase
MQLGILNNYPAVEELVALVAQAVRTARAKGMLVIYSVLGFRYGAPEMSPFNKLFNNKERFAAINMDEFMEVHPQLGIVGDDLKIVKRRVSAFSGSDLEIILRASGINHIVITGITTSGVVLSTVRQAADKDYRITVLADACADVGTKVHRVL